MCKKIITVILVFLCCSFCVKAQIKQGSILVGGAVYYTNTHTKNSNGEMSQKENTGFIDLSVGKAIKENSVVGIHLEFSPAVSNSFNDGNIVYKTKTTGYGAGVFYRKYKTLGKDFYFFLEAGADYLYGEQKTKDASGNKLQNNTYSLANLSLSPGISYKVFKNLDLEVSIPQLIALQYQVNKTNGVTQTSQNQFNFKTNLNASTLNNLSVGFRLIF